MRKISTLVTNYTAPSAGYSEGQFKDDPGDGTGSEAHASIINDLYYGIVAFIKKYLPTSDISDTEESETSSDFVYAMDTFLKKFSVNVALNTFSLQTSAADNQWESVAWSPGLGLFAAVSDSGTGNRVMTSPDGINWTIRTSAADNNWRDICWSESLTLFVAVSNTGTGNRVMTSPDGITWTIRTSAADNNWEAVCWSPDLTLFVAVAQSGTGNRVMTSPDGINWTIRTSAADNNWEDVEWSPSLTLFVAASSSGTDRIMTSPDGITWTSRTHSGGVSALSSVSWSPELGIFAIFSRTLSPVLILTSPDGINWTNQTYSGSALTVYDSCWSSELGSFIATGLAGLGTESLLYSLNGVDWFHADGIVSYWNGICWSPELGIFCTVRITGTGTRAGATEPFKIDVWY